MTLCNFFEVKSHFWILMVVAIFSVVFVGCGNPPTEKHSSEKPAWPQLQGYEAMQVLEHKNFQGQLKK